MQFNSAAFIFGFVPVVLLGFFLVGRWRRDWALVWLCAASLFFYGWWNPRSLLLLMPSILGNLGAARWIARSQGSASGRAGAARRALFLAVSVNLAVLAHFKYQAFLWNEVAALMSWPARLTAPELPLGISFFTFTQIAFLVDVYRQRVTDFHPLRYGLFVSYYPHLIAGPILHHAEIMPQFARADIFRFNVANLADGGVIFVLGLFKKAVLADQFAQYVNPAFEAARTQALSSFVCWGAALSYTFQLYFDFSGYSDMAIGLALMIGVRLPLNFHSPYKSRNIADFWRRWHMTLSRFLRDYLYFPLGGSRHGEGRRYRNLAITMILGGAWHGAGWTFIVWGGLHGFYLVIHGLWRRLIGRVYRGRTARSPPGLRAGAWMLTFLSVVVAWVLFRAADLPTAFSVLRGMAGFNGSLLPETILQFAPLMRHLAQGAPRVALLGDGSVVGAVELLVMLALAFAIVLLAPAMHELRNRTRYLLLLPCVALTIQQVLYGRSSPFLYFQF